MTNARRKKQLLSIIPIMICTGVLLTFLPAARAYAEDLGGYYYTADGAKVDASPNDAWSKALELQTGMGITQDFSCDRLYIEGGKKVFVELNGHAVNRNLSSNQNEGEVFYVDDNATLTVYGGTKDDPSAGGDVENIVRAWVTDTSGSLSQSTRSVHGGVITGGYSSNYGGGIEMRENATVNLNYVTVCGNRAEQTKGLDGYGGGVNMSRSYGRLYMDHASIVYNYAHNEGGGVFVNGGPGRRNANDCMIRMRHSHIDNNGAIDDGAGVAVRGERFQLIGDAKQVTNSADYSSEAFWSSLCFHDANAETAWGSTIAYNVIRDSDGCGGGGVYLWNDDGTVSGVNVIGNRALKGGCGGGIYTQGKNACIAGCNIAQNYVDAQENSGTPTKGGQGGGIYVGNNPSTIKESAIVGNSAVRSGAGVWVDGTVDVSVGGKLIIQDNKLTDDSQNNMFLQKKGEREAHVVVDSLSRGSLIGLTLDSDHSARVACGPGATPSMANLGETIDQRMFTSDGDAKYLYWNSKTNPWYDGYAINTDRSSISGYDERWLVARDRSHMPAGYDTNPNMEEREFQPDEGSALKRTDSYLVGDEDYGLYQGLFGMPNSVNSAKDLSVEFFYSDGYFMEDPKQYNEHLATMSSALALAASYSNMGNEGSPDNLYNTAGNGGTYYPIKCSNIMELLASLGVAPDDISVTGYNHQNPSANSMGVAIGSKKIGNKTLVILGAGGAGYEAGRESDETAGSVGETSDLPTAASIAFDELQTYLSAHNIDGTSEDTLFWLSGFSRAGAAVNLAAKRVVDTYDNGGNRTFAYPVEAPKGGLDYTCIHNVIDNESLTGDDYETARAEMVKQLRAVNPDVIYDDYVYLEALNTEDSGSGTEDTLAYDAARIVQNQCPEVVVSYLRGTDSYYKGGANDSYYIMNWPQNATQSFDLVVEVTHVADDGTTTTEVVHQEDFDKNIVLTSPDDTITLRSDPYSARAQVFYSYDGKDAWHQFNKPLTFPSIMDEGTFSQESGGYRTSNMTFYAFTASYATAEKGITVAYGVDCQLELGSYVDSAFHVQSQPVPVGGSLTVDAAERIQIPDAKGAVAKFARWRVERMKEDGDYSELTSDDKLASILGDDFDARAEKTTLTLIKKENLRIVPLFREYERISKLGVSAAPGNALATTLDLSVYGNDTTVAAASASKPVTWTQAGVSDDGKPVYVGEVKLALDDLCPINDGWGNDAEAAIGRWFPEDVSSVVFESDAYDLQELDLSQDGCECTLRVRVAEASEEGVWTLVVTPRNIVTGTAYENQTFYASNAGEDYRPDAPSLPHEEFCGWADGWTVDEATHTQTIVAWYRPVLDHVTLTVNHGIILGEELPEVQQMELQSGETTWHAADGGLYSAWRAAGDAEYLSTQTSAQAHVTYEAAYGLADFAPHADGLDDSAPAASFGIADDCSVEVKVGNDSLQVPSVSVQQASAAEEGLLTATVRYKPVLSKVTSVDAGDPMVFSHGLSADELCDALEGVRVHATLDGEQDGYVYTLRPNGAGDYDPGKLEQQSFVVACELTSDEYSLEDCSTVELPVTVLAAPEAQVPAVLTSGVYSEGTRLIIRHPDERANIWYAVRAVPVVTSEGGEDQTETPDFDSAEFVPYNENESVVFGSEYRGQRIYVCAYATQDGYNDSAHVVRSFEVMSTYAEVPYINAAGQDEDPKFARCLTAADANLTYWSDANGGWYAVTEDLTVDDRVWIQGKINLILCDGATLELVSGVDVAKDVGAKLIIWCQRGGTGALKAGHEVQGGTTGDIDDSYGLTTQSDGPVSLGDDEGSEAYEPVSLGEEGDSESDEAVVLGDDEDSEGDGPVVLDDDGAPAKSEDSPIDDEPEDNISIVAEESAVMDNAAGIGSRDGLALGEIAINGGVITSYGGKGAAGIGGCAEGEGDGVTIYNGTVTAVGGEGGAGIGSGRSGHLVYVLVQGGTVTATGGKDAAGIGGNVKAVALSWVTENDSITASSYACEKLENFQLLRNFRFSDETFLVKEQDVLMSVDKTLVPRPAPIGGPSFKSLSLELAGQIGVNFFVDLPAIEDVDYSQSYMEFMVGEQMAARAYYDAHKKSENGKYYGFTCYVSSVQMAEPITATFHYGDGQTAECTNYSVQEYVRLLQADADEHPGKYSDEAINLAHAIIDYGYYVQPFLASENHWGIDADYKQVDQDLVTAKSYDRDDIQSKVEEYEYEVELERSGLSDVTMRLNLNSSTSMEFLFTTPSAMPVDIYNSAYTLNPQDTNNGTRWCVTVPDIPAHKLGDMVEVTGGTDQSGFTISASPMTYAKIVLSDDPDYNEYSEEAKNAMCAFYKYYEAAMAFRNSLHTS